MNIDHPVQEHWMLLSKSGLNEFGARVWGSKLVGDQVNYYKCSCCGVIMAPFEVESQGYTVLKSN